VETGVLYGVAGAAMLALEPLLGKAGWAARDAERAMRAAGSEN
jgi:hypothetical protein